MLIKELGVSTLLLILCRLRLTLFDMGGGGA